MSSFADENTIVLVHGTLIDDTGGPPLPDAVVIIKAGRISAVGTGPTLKAPEGATILDVGKALILPGFINSHVHGAYNLSFRRVWARAGVTTVRDLAAYPSSSCALRDESNRDPVNSRLVASGPQMTAMKGFVPSGYPIPVFIRTSEDGVREGNTGSSMRGRMRGR
jgi:imidazolonepropionase-like amidohydrolase